MLYESNTKVYVIKHIYNSAIFATHGTMKNRVENMGKRAIHHLFNLCVCARDIVFLSVIV